MVHSDSHSVKMRLISELAQDLEKGVNALLEQQLLTLRQEQLTLTQGYGIRISPILVFKTGKGAKPPHPTLEAQSEEYKKLLHDSARDTHYIRTYLAKALMSAVTKVEIVNAMPVAALPLIPDFLPDTNGCRSTHSNIFEQDFNDLISLYIGYNKLMGV